MNQRVLPSSRYTSELLSAFWPALLGAAILVALTLWYFGGTTIDLQNVLRTLLVGGICGLLLLHCPPKLFGAVRDAIYHLAGVGTLAVAWAGIGGLQSPVFLLLFALPVFSATLVSKGWLEYLVAIAAAVAATVAALLTEPSFRWRMDHVGYFDWLGPDESLLPLDGAVLAYNSPVAVLGTFAVTMAAVAWVGSVVAREMRRLEAALVNSDRLRFDSESLASKLLQDSDDLIVRETGQVVAGTSEALALTGAQDTEVQLVEALQPTFPEQVAALLDSDAAQHAEAMLCRPAGQPRLFDLSVDSMQLGSEHFRHVRVRQTPPERLLAAALNDIGIRVAIIGPQSDLMFVSEEFAGLFPAAAPGSRASESLDGCHGLPSGWWDIAPARRSSMRIEDGDDCFVIRVRASETHDPGQLTYLHIRKEHAGP